MELAEVEMVPMSMMHAQTLNSAIVTSVTSMFTFTLSQTEGKGREGVCGSVWSDHSVKR